MATYKSDFLNTLDQRGFIHQCSDFGGLDALAAKGKAIAYVGYDCTAPSLHIGNFISAMMLHWLQQTGNKPITLMGGGTTRVGDPSGKDETRAIRSIEEIDANKESIKGVFAKLLKFGGGPTDAIMPNNADWLDKLGYIELLREIGPHFSISRMLSFDSVKSRLEREQGLTDKAFQVRGWVGCAAPVGTPEAIVQKLSDLMVEGGKTERVLKINDQFGIDEGARDRRYFKKVLDEEGPVVLEVIKSLNIEPQ